MSALTAWLDTAGIVALGILVDGRRHPNHPANPCLAPLQRQEHSDEQLEIEPVGFGPPRPTIHWDARASMLRFSMPAGMRARWIQKPS